MDDTVVVFAPILVLVHGEKAKSNYKIKAVFRRHYVNLNGPVGRLSREVNIPATFAVCAPIHFSIEDLQLGFDHTELI